MQWIKYKIKQCTIGGEDVLINKKVGFSSANLAIAKTEAYNGEYEIIEDGKTYDKEPLPISLGGTGATTTEQARENLNVPSTTDLNTVQTTANNAASTAIVAQTTANNAASAAQTAQNTADGKAPKSHASTDTTYGMGTSSNYGHVKLSGSISNTSGKDDGVAATPSAVREAYNRAGTGITNAAAALTAAQNAQSTADGKVKIQQIYLNTNYAVDFVEQDLMVGDYPMYFVEYKSYATDITYEHTTAIVVGRTKTIWAAGGNTKIRARSVEKISGGLHFYAGYDTSTVDNKVLVPFKIWGVTPI